MLKRTLLISFVILTLAGCNASTHTSVNVECVEISQQFPSARHILGNVVITGKNNYLYKGENQTKWPIPIDKTAHKSLLADFKVSPDRKKMVYKEYYYDQSGLTAKNLKLFQDMGTIEIVNPPNDLGTLIDWFDNDRLLFVPEGRPEGTIILFNPQTRQTEEIVGTFSDIYTWTPLPSWYGGFNPLPIYNPRLSVALYLRLGTDGMEYVLWDVKSKREIWKKRVTDPSIEPLWAPSGDQIVFAIPKDQSGFEFYSLDEDGSEKQLTDLGLLYHFVSIQSFSWSPDGRYIAFWMTAENSTHDIDSQLAVLNIERGEITNYCLGPGGMKPVWSPDGKQIAAEIIPQNSSSPNFTVVVDIDTRSAILLDENVYPIGWLR